MQKPHDDGKQDRAVFFRGERRSVLGRQAGGD